MADVEECTEGWGREVLRCTNLFCADNGLIESTNTEWLQGAFSTLTEFFDRVRLWVNIRKTARMLFHSCRAARTQLEESYKRRMMGSVLTYQDHQMLLVQ